MEDLFDDLVNKYVLCKESILQQVDPYTLFCHYYGSTLEVNKPVLSTVREDDTRPSFCLYYKGDELCYYDYGQGKGGDVFTFIKRRYGLTRQEAFKKVNHDFELGFEGKLKRNTPVINRTPKISPKRKLAITTTGTFSERAKSFWEGIRITESILKMYNVREVTTIHVDSNWFSPRSLCFAYYIGQYFKIYYPYKPRGEKFYNNYPRNYVEGFLQLPRRGRILVITKSLKDVMVFRRLGISSVSPKGENIAIPDYLLRQLESRFDRIVTFFDPDDAGKRGAGLYPYPARFLNNGVKDVSDYIRDYGLIKTRNLVAQLIHSI